MASTGSTTTISEEKLDEWSRYEDAAISSAQNTHTHIRERVEQDSSRLVGPGDGEMRFETRLQGSYANTTIVRGSGDVDILVRMSNPYDKEAPGLGRETEQQITEDSSTWEHEYGLEDFQSDVLTELRSIYGVGAVERGDKAIEINSRRLDLDADVVPCQAYRRYNSYNGDPHDESNYWEGIRFFTDGGQEIQNFPAIHKEKGAEINEAADGNYRETIRIFKRARNHLNEEGVIDKDDVASYFVECLLSNVSPETIAEHNRKDRFRDIIDELQDTNLQAFTTQHGLSDLFGYATTQWKQRKARSFIRALDDLYENGV